MAYSWLCHINYFILLFLLISSVRLDYKTAKNVEALTFGT